VEKLAMLLLFSIRVSFRVYTSHRIPWPHGTVNHISIRVSCRVYTSYTVIPHEHSRLAKKVKNGKRPTGMKSAEGSLFRQKNPNI
jgi:hypothetical protein